VVLIAFGLEARSGSTAVALALAFLALVVAAGGFFPWLLRRLRQEHDLFLIFTVASALALAGLGAAVFGIPLALAAFICGLAISESREATEARERLLPFREVFAVLFFVAIGALIDPRVLARGLGWLGVLLALVLLTKVLPVYLLARLARLPASPLQLAVGLGQIGEFSFVLATIGLAGHVIGDDLYAAILASVVLTIAASTVLARVRGRGRGRRAS
jgi:K+:H+ antiporter